MAIQWIIDGLLAGSARPGYCVFRTPVTKTTVDAWLAQVRQEKIASIICLLSDEHLQLYADCPKGLIAYYRSQGTLVKHLPIHDHKVPPITQRQLRMAVNAFNALPKPVIVHCSAGIDRTGAVARRICEELGVPYTPPMPDYLDFSDKGVWYG